MVAAGAALGALGVIPLAVLVAKKKACPPPQIPTGLSGDIGLTILMSRINDVISAKPCCFTGRKVKGAGIRAGEGATVVSHGSAGLPLGNGCIALFSHIDNLVTTLIRISGGLITSHRCKKKKQSQASDPVHEILQIVKPRE